MNEEQEFHYNEHNFGIAIGFLCLVAILTFFILFLYENINDRNINTDRFRICLAEKQTYEICEKFVN